MTLYLVRHAKAGERATWTSDDRLRPLSKRGQRQAAGLLDVFDGAPLDRLLSSPYVRCIESLVPLSGARGLAIEPVDALAEGAALDEVLPLLRKHANEHVVMCSHGDVIPMLLDHFATAGVSLGPAPQWPKGCTWIVDVDANGEATGARYVAPPPD